MLDVVSIGETLIDLTPADLVEGENQQYICNPGGAPANVAVILAKLGSKVSIISKVGKDHFGTLLEQTLLQCGVDTSMLSFTEEANTTLAFVHLNDEGDRSFSFYRKPGADTYLQWADVPVEKLQSSRLVHFGTVSMTHEPSRTATIQSVEAAKQSGTLISFDPNVRLALWDNDEELKKYINWGLSVADIVKISEEELSFVTGITSVAEGAAQLQQQYNITVLVVTLGAKGCYYRLSQHEGFVPTFQVKTIDTTGAGDAFMGSLLFKLLEHGKLDSLKQLNNHQMIEVLTFANASGALVTTKKGALQSMPTASEISELIETEQRRSKQYRPQFHFTAPTNWLNDPNGLVYYQGVYHLFYQHHPFGNKWGPMHWGHATSQDLIAWKHEPIALFPDEHGAIFSGCCVVDWNNSSGLFDDSEGIIAFFTHADTCPTSGNPRQRQSLAYSKDGGHTWEKYDGNPILVDTDLIDFRDPKVFWHEPSQKWVMLLVAGDRVKFYGSTNLREWAFTGDFGVGHGSHDGVWECPDLFQLPVDNEGLAKWVLIISIGDNHNCPEGSRTQYFIGEFDGDTFINDNATDDIKWLDYGRDNYAAVSWSDIPQQDGRRIMIGWMNNWKYANETPTGDWRGAMTIPRAMSLTRVGQDIVLAQQPVEELKQHRLSSSSWTNLSLSNQEQFQLDDIVNPFELELVLDSSEASELRIELASSAQCEAVIGYDPSRQFLYIDRSSADGTIHPQFPCKHGVEAADINGKLKLHILVDSCSIELFANDGVVALTDQIFPTAPIDSIKLRTESGTCQLSSLQMHVLQSIHEQQAINV